ncbi:hypothetical protein ACFLRH_03165, partial [Actinomycetota bacterium]
MRRFRPLRTRPDVPLRERDFVVEDGVAGRPGPGTGLAPPPDDGWRGAGGCERRPNRPPLLPRRVDRRWRLIIEPPARI